MEGNLNPSSSAHSLGSCRGSAALQAAAEGCWRCQQPQAQQRLKGEAEALLGRAENLLAGKDLEEDGGQV